jgi:hypothetical protein
MATENKAMIVWAKTYDDGSSFPNWASSIPLTFTDFFKVMSYNQHTATAKVATNNGGFYVSDQGHTVDYYKNLFPSTQGYDGPWGIFVEEILGKVESDYGADYFDDVDLIMMIITDGGIGWYLPSGNHTGIASLGVVYTTESGKNFDYSDGTTMEFSSGESGTIWNVCHEYGHFLGLGHRPATYGTYSLMYDVRRNENGETVTPLAIQDIVDLDWLDLNNTARVKTFTVNGSVTLKPIRSTTGIVAAKVNIPTTSQYFLISNHQRSTNVYDGTYPASGLLIWHISGSSGV